MENESTAASRFTIGIEYELTDGTQGFRSLSAEEYFDESVFDDPASIEIDSTPKFQDAYRYLSLHEQPRSTRLTVRDRARLDEWHVAEVYWKLGTDSCSCTTVKEIRNGQSVDWRKYIYIRSAGDEQRLIVLAPGDEVPIFEKYVRFHSEEFLDEARPENNSTAAMLLKKT